MMLHLHCLVHSDHQLPSRARPGSPTWGISRTVCDVMSVWHHHKRLCAIDASAPTSDKLMSLMVVKYSVLGGVGRLERAWPGRTRAAVSSTAPNSPVVQPLLSVKH